MLVIPLPVLLPTLLLLLALRFLRTSLLMAQLTACTLLPSVRSLRVSLVVLLTTPTRWRWPTVWISSLSLLLQSTWAASESRMLLTRLVIPTSSPSSTLMVSVRVFLLRTRWRLPPRLTSLCLAFRRLTVTPLLPAIVFWSRTRPLVLLTVFTLPLRVLGLDRQMLTRRPRFLRVRLSGSKMEPRRVTPVG